MGYVLRPSWTISFKYGNEYGNGSNMEINVELGQCTQGIWNILRGCGTPIQYITPQMGSRGQPKAYSLYLKDINFCELCDWPYLVDIKFRESHYTLFYKQRSVWTSASALFSILPPFSASALFRPLFIFKSLKKLYISHTFS